MTARELVMTRGWNATDYHILNPGIEHWFTSVLPLAVHQCQIFPRRRHDARFLCQALKKLFVAGSVIAPHDGSHRRVGFQCCAVDTYHLALHQSPIRPQSQDPEEYLPVRLHIDQPPGARKGRDVVQRFCH